VHSAARSLSAWLRADAAPPPQVTRLHRETLVRASTAEAFGFFSNANNLERLTPRWLKFEILTPPPIVMREGTHIDYRISLYGLPMPWRSRIDVWEPDRRFVDLQLVGPYRWWRHEHRFEPLRGGTLVVDDVEYLPRASWLSRARVSRDLDRIFAFRQEALRAVFRDDLSV
jgi:ligand-binding SRPBCC domain-containing protein